MIRYLAIAVICLISVRLRAQPGIDELRQARQQLSSSFFSAFDLALVLATLLGTFGALRIYHNWQMGQPRMDAEVAAWFFSALFVILSGTFLQALFGI